MSLAFQTGMDRRDGFWRRLLAGRRVALVSHQAALCRGGGTSAQRLRALLGDRLSALMGPEHGFFLHAPPGVPATDLKHPDWGMPVYSLYGEHKEPTSEMLRGVDTVVVDFQDLGVRCYTYLATLFGVMRACERMGKELIVADRPVPLAHRVDGPMPETAWLSFVCPAELPFCHGMTQGEAARWYRRHRGLRLDLRIVPVRGYGRESFPGSDWPEWVPPSPAIRSWASALCYPITVFSEAFPPFDVGRGGALAFRVLGAAGLSGVMLCERLSVLRLPGMAFHPHRFAATRPESAVPVLDGIRISVTDARRYQPLRTALALLQSLTAILGEERVWGARGVRLETFDRLFGSPATRLALLRGDPLSEIRRRWARERYAFLAARREALLYEPAAKTP